MKKLTLIRHAKSSWTHNLEDHKRPLKKRGIKDANLISNCLRPKFLQPDFVFSSDAERAKQTAQIFVKNLEIDSAIFQLKNELYDFSGYQLINVIKSCDNSISNLLLFGHNHAITAFVNTYGSKNIDNVPTCGLVSIDFNIDKWDDLKQGTTIKTLFPRDLKY